MDGIQTLPSAVTGSDSETEQEFTEAVRDFFGIVEGGRLEDDLIINLHTPTGDILASHTEEDGIARLSVGSEISVEEVTQSEFAEMRRDNEIETVSRPDTGTRNVAIHD